MPTPTQIGRQDYAHGIARKANPYRLDGPSRTAWFAAWDAAAADEA